MYTYMCNSEVSVAEFIELQNKQTKGLVKNWLTYIAALCTVAWFEFTQREYHILQNSLKEYI